MAKRKTILYISHTLSSPYHRTIVLGISDTVKELDMNLVLLSAGPFRAKHGLVVRRAKIMELYYSGKYDGIILPVSSLCMNLSEEETETFVHSFGDIPIVSISESAHTTAYVYPDYKNGIYDLMDHICHHHQYKSFIFVQGPEGHPSSVRRFGYFNDYLKKHGLEESKIHVMNSRLNAEGGKGIAAEILEKGIKADVIITTNDQVAAGILEFFQNHDIRVPEDYAICGYQGNVNGFFTTPALTTVNEMSYDLGCNACTSLNMLINKKTLDKQILVPSKLMVRESCGCKYGEGETKFRVEGQGLLEGIHNDPVLESLVIPKGEETLGKGDFENLRNYMLLKHSQIASSIYNLFKEFNYASILNQDNDYEFIIETLKDLINPEFIHIVLYDKSASEEESDMVSLTRSYIKGRPYDRNGRAIRFNKKEILPDAFWIKEERVSLIVVPLFTLSENLGYLVMNFSARECSFYESIQAQFSAIFDNMITLTKLNDAQQRFRDIALSSSDWLWEFDRDGVFSYSSMGVEKVLGYTIEEVMGLSLFDLCGEGKKVFKKMIKDRMSSKLPINDIESRYVHKNGTERVLVMSGLPILDKERNFMGCRGVFKDITEEKVAEDRIKFMAYYDQLTKLPNRTLLMEHIGLAISNARRSGQRVGLMFLDLDHFKMINDTMGHDAGDDLLVQVANRVAQCKRDTDTLARIGGDEFVILLPNIQSCDSSYIVANRILESLQTPFSLHGTDQIITSSVGIAIYPSDGISSEVLLKNADSAMYKAKEKGKNCFMFYDDEMETRRLNRLEMKKDIALAMVRDEFEVLYQTIVGKDNNVISCNASLHWNCPERGQLHPDDFIAVLDETGLMREVGNWYFKTAANQVKEWRKGKRSDLTLTVKVYQEQFGKKDFLQDLKSILRANKIETKMLTLEIEESTIASHSMGIINTLTKIKDEGFNLVVNYCGTGYSSLNFLTKLPIEYLKIDKCLTTDCEEKDNVLSTVIELAHSSQKQVIAEGIDSKDQEGHLKFLNCDFFQGDFLSGKLIREDMEKLLFHS